MEARRQKHNILHMSMLNIHSLCKMKVQVSILSLGLEQNIQSL